jgi:hypothetical protein
MNLNTTSKSNYRPNLSLSAGLISKKSTSRTQSELSKELASRIENVSSLKMGKLFHFIVTRRVELAIFAIKTPSKWLLFSQCMLQKFNTDCRIARLLKKLNHLVKDFDRAQCNKGFQKEFTDGTFGQVFPKELRQQFAFNIPPSFDDNSATLEKIRLILLEDLPPPNDSFSQIKSIPVKDLVHWINTYHVGLKTLKIVNAKLNLLLPKLRSVNLDGYPKGEISSILKNLKKAHYLSCDQMTDLNLEILSTFGLLTSLDISGSKEITDEGITFLKHLNLKHLNISNCPLITDAALTQITNFNSLERLEISGCTGVTDEGIEILSLLSKLTYLDLSEDTNITSDGLQAHIPNNQLAYLDLSYSNISDADVNIIGQFSNLQILKLIGCKDITIEGLKDLKNHPKLKCIMIGDKSFTMNCINKI